MKLFEIVSFHGPFCSTESKADTKSECIQRRLFKKLIQVQMFFNSHSEQQELGINFLKTALCNFNNCKGESRVLLCLHDMEAFPLLLWLLLKAVFPRWTGRFDCKSFHCSRQIYLSSLIQCLTPPSLAQTQDQTCKDTLRLSVLCLKHLQHFVGHPQILSQVLCWGPVCHDSTVFGRTWCDHGMIEPNSSPTQAQAGW